MEFILDLIYETEPFMDGSWTDNFHLNHFSTPADFSWMRKDKVSDLRLLTEKMT